MGFNVVDYMRKCRAKNYFAIQSWWVANDLWIGEGFAAYKGPLISKPMQPQQTINPRPSGKKPIALQLYIVIAESPDTQTEYIVLAKDESEARKTVETQYRDSPVECTLIPGPFKNGTVLMSKKV